MNTSYKTILALFAMLAAATATLACDNDDYTSQPPEICTDDNTIDIDGDVYCIVIEEGFLTEACPDEFPEGYQVEEVVVCGDGPPPEDIEEELKARGFLSQESADCPDPSDLSVTYFDTEPDQCALRDFSCEEGQRPFNDDCGCGCIGQPETTCPDPSDPSVTYFDTDPDQCALRDFSCEEGQRPFNDDCGCGCIGQPETTCPDPSDPSVTYFDTDPDQCALRDFSCEEGQRPFNDDCGCGCIGQPETTCPDPSDPSVTYFDTDPDQCALRDFSCEEGQRPFNDDCGCGCIDISCYPASAPGVHYLDFSEEACASINFQCPEDEELFDNFCGCGCIDTSLTCPDSDAPGVSYLGNSREECALIDFDCADQEDYFLSDCGCGCIPNARTRECPLPEIDDVIAFETFSLPPTCSQNMFDLRNGIATDQAGFEVLFQCDSGTDAGIDFTTQTIVRGVIQENPDISVHGVLRDSEGVVTVYLTAAYYCGGARPQDSFIDIVIDVADVTVEFNECGYDAGNCDGPGRP